MAVPTITLREGLFEVVLILALPPAASTGATSRAAKPLMVAKNVLLFIG